ncbi:hypothetical protein A2W14_06495 [Candidatus Gottesmanbacteria bacterium RBG_16_37_8]|uniref:Uncharacterized protein n=1 Tax=Candidatus Gottesmanbacteria bacterium RBG_16_37_8 TaxID=1798371 RepID=A0A1F5YQH8_9BACT|nr:MAG: hypothetical protein A2W14_06495 [Candidatus Gottesmanbacteria bacterium RBG_16_37_8]
MVQTVEMKRPYSSLERTIGPLPSEVVIFRAGEEIVDPSLFETDDFLTRVTRIEGESYDSGFLQYLFRLTSAVDNQINQTSSQYPHVEEKPSEGHKRMLTRLHNKEYMAIQQSNYIDTLSHTKKKLSRNGNSVLITYPLWGSLAILRASQSAGFLKKDLIPVDISGSVGIVTGFAKAKEIPKKLKETKNVIIFADDTFDTCISFEQLVMTRIQEKVKNHESVEILYQVYRDPEAFEEKIRKAKKGKLSADESEKIWSDLAKLAWEADVISAPFTIKNRPFAEAVFQLSADKLLDPKSTDWDRLKAQIQGQLMFQTLNVNPAYWIVGGKWDGISLLDTKLRGDYLMGEIIKNKERYQLSEEHLEYLRKWGLPNINIRALAGLEGLWVFNPDGLSGKEAISRLYKYYAFYIANYAKSRLEKEEKSIIAE